LQPAKEEFSSKDMTSKGQKSGSAKYSIKIGRSALTGQFVLKTASKRDGISLREATTVVETIRSKPSKK
jgi:hypothetical protein